MSNPVIKTGTMMEFIDAKGWTYAGDCGCRDNKATYVNPNYRGWQIWIAKHKEFMQIRQKNRDSVDTFIKAQCGPGNYIQEYTKYFS